MANSEDTKKIPLTQGKFAIVDYDDYDFLMQWKWSCNSGGYALRRQQLQYKGKTIWMHRVINNTPDDLVVDHIDGNPLNNTKINLRNVTVRQNRLNNAGYKKSSSKYKGVSFDSKTMRWRAYISTEKQFKSLGYFKDENEAGIAYNNAAKILFGEFAYINIIPSDCLCSDDPVDDKC